MPAPDRVSPGSAIDLQLRALAARAQLGDRQALEAMLRMLQDPLAEHIRSIVRDDDLVADVLQDTLLIVCRKLGTLRDTAWVRAWAYRVATRESVRASRRARRHRGEPLFEMAEAPDPSAAASSIDEETLAELPVRLAALPPGAQVVLRMHYLDSMSQQQVAEALEIPLGTVKSRIGYGLALLRKTWRREAG